MKGIVNCLESHGLNKVPTSLRKVIFIFKMDSLVLFLSVGNYLIKNCIYAFKYRKLTH